MTDPTIALKEYLINKGLAGEADFLRQSVELLSQMLIELEVEQQIGAGKHERTTERTTYRNGYRDRTWETESLPFEDVGPGFSGIPDISRTS